MSRRRRGKAGRQSSRPPATPAGGETEPPQSAANRPRWPAHRLVWLVPPLALLCLFPLTSKMPTWDQWSLVPLWQAHYGGEPVLPHLLSPYAGHLNVVPRLVFYVLGLISHWNVRWEVVANFVVASLTMALLLRLLRREGLSHPALVLAFAVQVFSFVQFENFLSGYPLGQNIEQLAATAVVVVLTGAGLRWRGFAAAVLAAVCATFSWGAGLAAWPVGFLALLWRPERRRAQLAIWAAFTLATAWLARSAAHGTFPPVPWGLVPSFVAALIGRPWSLHVFPQPSVAIAYGVVALVAFAVLATAAWRLRGRAAQPWILLGTLALGSAGLIALGRAGSGLQQALPSHYTTATYPLLLACAALLVILLPQFAGGRARAARLPAAATLAVAALLIGQAVWVSKATHRVVVGWTSTARSLDLKLVRGTATDDDIRRATHPEPELVRQGVALLRTHGLAWFRELADEQIPSGGVLTIDGRPVADFQARPVIAGDWSFTGWAVRSVRDGGAVKAVYLNVDGRRAANAVLDLPGGGCSTHGCFPGTEWSLSLPDEPTTPGEHTVTIVSADFQDRLFTLYEGSITAGASPSSGAAGD